MDAKRKYNTLHTLGSVVAGLGWVVAVLMPIAGIYGSSALGEGATLGTYLYVGALVPMGLVFVGIGQSFKCLVSIEQNTREAAQNEE